MKYLLRWIFCIAFPICLFAQVEIQTEAGNGPNPWSDLNINNHPDQFQFIIVTDRTGGHRPGIFEDAMHKINLLQPEFVMSVGDLIEGYTEDTAILRAEWEEFTGFIDHLEMPFFYVPGNHDLTNAVMEEEYIKRFGKTYYHFVYKDVLFLCLNSEDMLRGAGNGSISEPQFNYIKSTLEKYPDVRYTFLFLHQPLWIQRDPKFWPQVEELLTERPHTVFAGHYHHYVKRSRNNGRYIMLATTGGGSGLRGSSFGEFDHVVWVTVNDDEPVIANLWLKGIWDENISTEETETFLRNLAQSQMIQIEPVFIEGDDFSEASFDIKISNHFDLPLKVKIDEQFGWDIWTKVDADSVELAPNSVEILSGHMQARNDLGDLKSIRATPLRFWISTTLSEYGAIEVPVPFNIRPNKKVFISESSGSVQVDGNVDDWASLPEVFQTTTDNKLDFGIKYDSKYMYIGAHVSDDKILVDTSQSLHRQDCIGMQVAFSPAVKSAFAPSDYMYLRITPATDKLPSISNPRNIPETWKVVCKANSTGYDLEVAVPINELNNSQGGNWGSVRLNWYIDDLDHPDDWKEIERDWYFPSWRSRGEILGTGMYFRK